jgi:SAM-dependent methyltransferase
VTTAAIDRPSHWDATYERRAEDSLSWFQAEPVTSIRLVHEAIAALPPARGSGDGVHVVDVGAGTSRLVDALAADARLAVSVLDVSERATAAVRERLAASTSLERVTFVVADVTSWTPERPVDVWHDRAVFHFLTDPAERDAYVRTVTRALRPGGSVILATFAPDGPDVCSALPVQRYGADELVAALGDGFEPVHAEREEPVTPDGRVQPFTWVVLRRRAQVTDAG